MERLPDAVVQLVVDNGAPVLWLFVSNCLNICKATVGTLPSNGTGTEARCLKTEVLERGRGGDKAGEGCGAQV